jgi:hypothetical protein
VPNSPVSSAYAPRAYLGLLQRQAVKTVVNRTYGIHCNVTHQLQNSLCIYDAAVLEKLCRQHIIGL